MSELFEVSEEAAEAIREKKAVVALESTIISHGMPYPQNVETALRVEAQVRSHGAVPATIAVIKGRIKVGLSADEIEYIGKEGGMTVKCSRRDLPFVAAKRLNGALTVAGTMICADMAGIRIFATGGIGGVHRGGELSMDVSADLEELARTEVAVFCAGCKSILDIGRTLEYLETKGVAVIGYGTDVMPAFYTSNSPFKVPMRLDSPDEIARFISVKRELGMGGGCVIANPVPDEFSMDEDIINAAIDEALEHCRAKGITGKEITPFLLAEVKDITGGDSLEANIGLVLNNAALAADTAAAMERMA
ncbi:MAG: pseudouridine-5'-phosphate glycosidase [Eubacteriaceae bacterium]|nr:pseudouridine-5'-phosphate glycosidase [Eubacteriaceae bacterium]